MYELYNAETLKKDIDAERKLWLEAPVTCKTNREQHSISFVRAQAYAYATRNVVIHWKYPHFK